MSDLFDVQDTLSLNHQTYRFFNLNKLPQPKQIAKLPFCLKILLENLLRHQDHTTVTSDQINALIHWDPNKPPSAEITFSPSRVILQDFTGVPAMVDLATLRDAMIDLKAPATRINPVCQVDLVIDHSVMVDHFGTHAAFSKNTAMEFERNRERYTFLKWGQKAFQNFRVVPPGTGIVHQVNLEYLAEVVSRSQSNHTWIYPDTLVGTDSHTTMINGLGILGWGVGGIEAEAAMLGQPITMLIPNVVGFKLIGSLKEGVCATDLVLTIVQILREKGVVGKFVEFFGEDLKYLSVADRATIANMAPEYGATCGIFPIDQQTLDYLQLTGRSQEQIHLVEHYAKQQGLFYDPNTTIAYSEQLSLDLATVEPSIAGPKRPQDRIQLKSQKKAAPQQSAPITIDDQSHVLKDNDVVIAAITSCTNTSNPTVMIAAGLLAKAAVEKGIAPKPWVKTSLAPGSQVVTEYLDKAQLTPALEALGFNLVGYGCTTCIGNSGPLLPAIEKAISTENLCVSAVLSGNRNFEGRIHPLVKNAYLASPPLVVAYALAGTMNIDFDQEPIAYDTQKQAIWLKDLWPTQAQIQKTLQSHLDPSLFKKRYQAVFEGDEHWRNLQIAQTDNYPWDPKSTYVQLAPYFKNLSKHPKPIHAIQGARVLVWAGDSITTDHISPAGSIAKDSPAGQYLLDKGIKPFEFNSYGSRRGNHDIMIRGTFANIRFQNKLTPDRQGSWTQHFPTQTLCSIYDAAKQYALKQTPLIILAGKDYGAGSSRDWAAKGPCLLGVCVVIAESFERIHRSNLIGMGILPLTFLNKENANSLGLTGAESFDFDLKQLAPKATLAVKITDAKQQTQTIQTQIQIQTPKELQYFQNGGILHYVLRKLAKESS